MATKLEEVNAESESRDLGREINRTKNAFPLVRLCFRLVRSDEESLVCHYIIVGSSR